MDAEDKLTKAERREAKKQARRMMKVDGRSSIQDIARSKYRRQGKEKRRFQEDFDRFT